MDMNYMGGMWEGGGGQGGVKWGKWDNCNSIINKTYFKKLKKKKSGHPHSLPDLKEKLSAFPQ